MDVFELQARISLDIEEYEDGLSDASAKTSGFGDNLKSGLSSAAKVAATAITTATTAAVAFGASSVKAASEWETSFAQVQTIMDTTQMSTEDMSAAILALSNDMGISASELSGTVYNAISATGDTANAVSLAAQASRLATAGFTDTGSALSVLTTAMNAYGLSSQEAERISDSLITVQNLGVTTVAELSSSMGKAIASASAYGVNLQNLESAYVSITKAGISTAEGTTYISSMLKELGDAGSSVSQILQAQTGQSFDQLMQSGSSLADVLGILYDSVGQDSTALMNLWSSAEAGKASSAIISQGLEEFNANLETISNSANATESAYATMADTMDHKMNVLKTTFDNLKTKVGSELSPAMGEFADYSVEALSNIATAFEEGGISGAMDALGEEISNGISMIAEKIPDMVSAGEELLGALSQGIIDNLPEITNAAVEVITTLASDLASNMPQMLDSAGEIITTLMQGIADALPELAESAIEIVTSVVEYITDNMDDIIQVGFDALEWLVDGILSGLPDMIEKLPEIIDGFLNFITDHLPQILDKGVELLSKFGTGIINAIPQLREKLPQVIMSITNFTKESAPKIIKAGLELLGNLIEGMLKQIPVLVSKLPQIISAIVDGIKGMMSDIVAVGGNIVDGVWQGIENAIDWFRNKVTNFFSGIVNSVKSALGIKSPSKVFAEIGGYMAEGLGVGWDDEYKTVKKDIESGLDFDFGTTTVDFAASAMGVSTAGVVNSMSAVSGDGTGSGYADGATYTFNLMLPDGTKLASYMFNPLTAFASANGTPILNPN